MSVRKRKTTFTLTVSHYKILETIKELNEKNLYPTPKGVNNILKGEILSIIGLAILTIVGVFSVICL